VQYDGNFWKDQNTTVSGTTSVAMSGYEGFNVKYNAQDDVSSPIEFKRFEFDDGDEGYRGYNGSRTFITTYYNITHRGKLGDRIQVRSSFIPTLTGYDGDGLNATVTTIGDANGTVEVWERWPTERAYLSADNDNGESLYDEDRIVWGYEPMTISATDTSIARTFPISSWHIDYNDGTTDVYNAPHGNFHPANLIVTHEDLFTHTYQRANTYYVTLYNEASTTSTKSSEVFRRASQLETDTLNSEVTCRVDVYPWNQTNNFFLVSGESVASDYTANESVSTTQVTTNGGTFISGYAPNLTVMFQESCTPVSFPISSYHWNYGDVFAGFDSFNTVCATDVQTGFGAGWITDKTNHTVTHTYQFPGLYNVSLSSMVSADPTYAPAFPFSLSAPVCSRDILVYVKEIDPQASFLISPASAGPWGLSAEFTSSPQTICFNASTSIAESFEIGRVVYDFGDGEFQTVQLEEWTPSAISTEAWFDAADTDTITIQTGVSQWSDKSENNNHLTQGSGASQPEYGSRTLNGITVPKFDGSNDRMELTTIVPLVSTNFGREVWAVFIVDSHDTTNHIFGNSSGNVQVAITPKGATGDSAPPKHLRLWCCGASDAWTGATKSDSAIISGDPYFAGWLAHNDFKEFSVNGNFEPTTDPYDASKQGFNNGLPLRWMGGGQFSPRFDGVIAEAIITSDALTDDERQKMESYLARKWGLVDKLPIGHPYNSPQNQTVCHEYTRTLSTQPSTFTACMTAFAYNTDTYDTYCISGLGPLAVAPTSAVEQVDWPTHLLATGVYDTNDDLLLVFEGDKKSTFNYVLSTGT
jgi:hypothetical protein